MTTDEICTLQVPPKLLEINVISAHDLPPVSKLLRTFVVAWLHPDNKLTTRVDHKGHTNPTWSYKLVFPVDEELLSLETTLLTVQIYNMAWLRDIPIGTACVPVKNLLSPAQKKSGSRPITLKISRPSGLLQGILNIGVNLVDINTPGMPSYSELSIATAKNNNDLIHDDDSCKSYSPENENENENENKYSKFKLHRSNSERTSSFMDGLSFARTKSVSNYGSQCGGVSKKYMASNGSMCSMMMQMKPIPSEVVAGLKKGVCSTSGNDYGSSIFDNWTVAPEDDCRSTTDDSGENQRLVRWRAADQIPLLMKDDDDDRHQTKPKASERRRKSKSDGGGLLSCFGNAYGFEFSIICGNDVKKNRKKVPRKDIPAQEKLRKFHL